MKEISLDYFKAGEFANGTPIKQADIINLIKSDKFKKDTDICRGELSGSKNKDRRREYKTKNLPLVTFGGTFNNPRSKASLKQHSGQASIDFDEYDKEKSDALFEDLKKDKYCHVIFKSPSYGLKVIVKIPMVDTDERYKDYFYGLINYFKKFSPKHDTGCADISRLCFLSYDPGLYVNDDSKIFDIIGKKEEKVTVVKKTEEYIPKYCPFIEKIAALTQLPSGAKTRHAYLDASVWKYCKHNKKDDVMNGYVNAQSRSSGTFNNSDKFVFSCGTIRNYLKGNKENGFVMEGLKLCNVCAEYEQYKIQSKDILLPGKGRLVSEFAERLGSVFSDKHIVFFKPQEHIVTEIRKIKEKDKDEEFLGFHKMESSRFVTTIEKYITPGVMGKNEETDEWEFSPKSMSATIGNIVLESNVFQEKIPLIKRIFTVPLPILYLGDLSFPTELYDKRFYSWLPQDAPKITNQDMSLEDAKKLITLIFKEFPFQEHQDYINAVAGFITPFLRGLYSNFNIRSPIFFYLANRERAGKDYCAGVTGMLYEGCALEEPPISGEKNDMSNREEELRKKLLSAFISGRKRLHFANCKGHINNSTFEQVSTATVYSDRILGKSEVIKVDNELEFSLSGNIGVSYTPDFANRCRFVRLMFADEDANGREFENPQLHNWVLKNRGNILSALYSLVRNWVDKGMPKGTVAFTSFPEWADICGGIMEAAGYDSPCKSDKSTYNLGGDVESDGMKLLYEYMFDHAPNVYMTKSEIRSYLLQGNANHILPEMDLTDRSGQTKFGFLIEKFVNRVMSDIKLLSDNTERTARRKYKFTKEMKEMDKKTIFGANIEEICIKDYENDGNLGNIRNVDTNIELKKTVNEYINTIASMEDTTDTQVTKHNTTNIKFPKEKGDKYYEGLQEPHHINCYSCGNNPTTIFYKGKYFCCLDCLKSFRSQI